MLLTGRSLGRYHLERLLEQGGMSDIYVATDTRLHRKVAVKVIRRDIVSQADTIAINEAVQLFRREAKVVIELEHPHILPLYDYGEKTVEGFICTFLVMPYRTEGSLAGWVRKRNRSGLLSLREAEHFLFQAADALQYAHDHHIIHRDVKPSNFLICSNQHYPEYPDIQLSDFGVAKFLNALSTPSQTIRGTPNYMAPEQWRGEAVPQSDQYALTVMLYEFLTGRLPFQGSNPEAILYQHMYEQPVSPSALNPQVPRSVARVILRALSKRPEQRYPSISAFARDFQTAVDNGEEIAITLTISAQEALEGTKREVRLADGRVVSLEIPTRVQNGEVLRYEGLGEPSKYGGLAGALAVTIFVQDTQEVLPFVPMDTREGYAPTRHFVPPLENIRGRRPRWKSLLLTGIALLILLVGLTYVGLSIFSSDSAHPPTVFSGSLAPTLTSQARTRAASQAQANQLTATASAQAAASATALSQAAATSTALANQRATAIAAGATATAIDSSYNQLLGQPTVEDPLSANTPFFQWDNVDPNSGGGCIFSNGGYHSIEQNKGHISTCFAENTNFASFAFEVEMELAQGDRGGIVFRADSNNLSYYYFSISSDGTFIFQIIENALITQTVVRQLNPPINTAPGQKNLLTVLARGNAFILFANKVPVFRGSDSTFTNGSIGVAAENEGNSTEAVFSNARIWQYS